MANDYGIIICDQDRQANAGNIGRSLITGAVQTWMRQTFLPDGTMQTDSVKAGRPYNGQFTGNFLIMVHGNYNETNVRGHLYAEGTDITNHIINYVNNVPLPPGVTKGVYIFACGQGRQLILDWYKSANAFNTQNVWCPCTTAMMGGAIDIKDIKNKFGMN